MKKTSKWEIEVDGKIVFYAITNSPMKKKFCAIAKILAKTVKMKNFTVKKEGEIEGIYSEGVTLGELTEKGIYEKNADGRYVEKSKKKIRVCSSCNATFTDFPSVLNFSITIQGQEICPSCAITNVLLSDPNVRAIRETINAFEFIKKSHGNGYWKTFPLKCDINKVMAGVDNE